MKQIAFILLLVAVVTGCAKKPQFVVEGQIENAAGQKVLLYRMDLNRDVAIDSVTIKRDGSFKFRQPALSEPTFLKLSLSPTSFITLLADTTEHIVVRGESASFARRYVVENSTGSRHVQTLKRDVTRLRTVLDSLVNHYNTLSDEQKSANLERIGLEMDQHLADYKKRVGEFVMDNPRSFASYYALFLTLSDGSMVMNVMDKKDQVYFAMLATSLNLLYPDSERVRHLYDFVLNVKVEERRARMLEALMETEGSDLPEIVAANAQGVDVPLSSLRGKVILISFWASWDGASRRENQTLKRMYQRYKNRGFEIYQIGLERSRVLWENALVQDEIDWTSVTEMQYTDSYAARVYNIQQLPANYLISRDGEIIGKDLFGSRLEERLREIFK
ncbi:TlpA disulfide reductase family protein [Alkaliflexus imshenetskii]|uniref:TlpA disulfide reductase family protein n=1 Tax=Alkaliflexus imshenetskii TaxID=286730 RepID=UPI00047A4F6A|nr:TlpA disulfide reductase family protein [Alkaliflexus imshenetskii]